MTWEWAFLISVILVCITAIVCFAIVFVKELQAIDSDSSPDFKELKEEISKIKADHESVHKLVEESKKLLSQANLAAGFTPRGQR